MTDAAGVVTKYEIDGLGRNKAKYIKYGTSYKKVEDYTYDSTGRLSSKKTYRVQIKEQMKFTNMILLTG